MCICGKTNRSKAQVQTLASISGKNGDESGSIYLPKTEAAYQLALV
jgi:hypothetical protein